MTVRAHGKEPWRFEISSEHRVMGWVVSADTKPVAQDADAFRSYRGDMVAESVFEENGRRIVACVNACTGISTEELERLQPGAMAPGGDALHDAYLAGLRDARADIARCVELLDGRISEEVPVPSPPPRDMLFPCVFCGRSEWVRQVTGTEGPVGWRRPMHHGTLACPACQASDPQEFDGMPLAATDAGEQPDGSAR